jgi:low affinity Fe/Cu permease
MDYIILVLATAIITAIVTVFVYRNNQKDISKVADKVDELVKKLEDAKKEKFGFGEDK